MLESLNCGILIKTIPTAYDQLGEAARVAWSSYGARQNTRRLQPAITTSGGVAPTNINEQAIHIAQPVP